MPELIRGVPFEACPNLDCKRKKRCLKLANQNNCLKTHYLNKDEMFDEITAIINRLQEEENTDEDPVPEDVTGEECASMVYQLLRKRALDEGWIS